MRGCRDSRRNGRAAVDLSDCCGPFPPNSGRLVDPVDLNSLSFIKAYSLLFFMIFLSPIGISAALSCCMFICSLEFALPRLIGRPDVKLSLLSIVAHVVRVGHR